jgi:hypothetical protein
MGWLPTIAHYVSLMPTFYVSYPLSDIVSTSIISISVTRHLKGWEDIEDGNATFMYYNTTSQDSEVGYVSAV